MNERVLKPHPGLSTNIGYYLSGMEEVRSQLVADLVRPEQRGTAYGLYNLAFGVTVFPASFLMGMIWDWKGPTVAFLVSAFMGATAALLLLIFVRPHQVLQERVIE